MKCIFDIKKLKRKQPWLGDVVRQNIRNGGKGWATSLGVDLIKGVGDEGFQ